jgi:hypothetical protein
MQVWKETSTWVFLTAWSTLSSFYWYYKFRIIARVLSDPKFLNYVIKKVKEMEKNGEM